MEGNRVGDAGSLRWYCTMTIFDRRIGARELEIESICVAVLDRLAAGARASRETNGGVPYIAAGGRVARDVPLLSCQFPVRNVPG